MKAILIFAEFVALSWAESATCDYKFKTVDTDYVSRATKVLSLFERFDKNGISADYYKIGKNYSIESNIDNYTNKKAVEDFLTLYKTGFMPKNENYEFSIFHEQMRVEAIALFRVLYYAKDFDVFYNTTAWAKVHVNEGQFLYVYDVVLRQRPDTQELVFPEPYEIYHRYFFNMDVLYKQLKYFLSDEYSANEYGIVKEKDSFVFYANLSSPLTYPNEEHRLNYFMEDVEVNAHLYYFHINLPFWWNSNKLGEFKDRRGEGMFNFYRKMSARYGFERDSNSLAKTTVFSWFLPLQTGYHPQLSTGFASFAQRSNNYAIYSEKNLEPIRFLDAYEKTFSQYLQQGHFSAFDEQVNFTDPKTINFVGNYWETNADLYSEEYIKNYQRSYEVTARQVLGASPKSYNKYAFLPSALHYFQTSLRDPVFYQLLQRIVDYFKQFMQHLPPYSYNDLSFKEVQINDVKIDKLVTYFRYGNYDVTDRFMFTQKDHGSSTLSTIRQPRLNSKPFSVGINVKSDVDSDVVFKIFIGPKYNSNGYPLNFEVDWVKFLEVDWFVQRLNFGSNNVTRNSCEFLYFKDEVLPTSKIRKYLNEGKVPLVMTSSDSDKYPRRMMLPRGTNFGHPLQFCVFIYPYNPITKDKKVLENIAIDDKPSSYPFDRPVKEAYLKQPNMFCKDVKIYHKGPVYPYQLKANTQNKQ